MIQRDEMKKHKTEKGEVRGREKRERERWQSVYRDVMSLRAWSSSSLMALYFNF